MFVILQHSYDSVWGRKKHVFCATLVYKPPSKQSSLLVTIVILQHSYKTVCGDIQFI